ncbi:uncharacterized protein ACA1_112970 [Acanthamoeba castellanii str. Neff]|uniref:Uncharacterized protein n=1 Tax=Acanthamoeba castellanii (strain ATCC 30010 / Neff) TaxID=1257118 RepID=L8H453_ACACF|nr:uncharacterized protein ACA1_112970 [Acanthamoeba castellanii str. Neff]ELR19992.1 hypothetical protein ACA1_112970 [Acanthamoeba castellanii str. Neff]
MAAMKTFVALFVVASLFAVASGVRFLSLDASLLLGADPFALERVDNINYALALASLTGLAQHADAVCLQGYWLPYQVQKLQAILTPYLPHSYSATPAAGNCSCQPAELTGLFTCLSGCITGGLNALVTNTTTFPDLLTTCMGNVGKDVSTCSPYGGYSGNVLFSRSPLTQPTTRSLALAPGLFNSDAIFATSSFSGVGNVQLVCTQLQPAGPVNASVAAALSGVNYLQTQTLQGLIETAVNQTRVSQVVVMGNFKQGPTIVNATSGATLVEPINEAYYGLWLQALYQDPAAADQRCTYCNSLSIVSPYLVNTMSSHIFVRGFDNNANVLSVTGKITFDNTTTILDLTSGSTPQARTVPYSPNYGVQVDISTVPSSASALLPATAALLRYVAALAF